MRGINRSLVNSPHKSQWPGALTFSLIYALNKRLSKQSWDWWFETPWRSLWRHRNIYAYNLSMGNNISVTIQTHARAFHYQITPQLVWFIGMVELRARRPTCPSHPRVHPWLQITKVVVQYWNRLVNWRKCVGFTGDISRPIKMLNVVNVKILDQTYTLTQVSCNHTGVYPIIKWKLGHFVIIVQNFWKFADCFCIIKMNPGHRAHV